MCTVLLPPGDNPIAVNKYIISKFHIEKLHELHSSQLFKQSNQGGDRQGIWHACGRQTHIGF